MSILFPAITTAILLVTMISAKAGDVHVGPVTDIAISGKNIFSCSQAGIFEGTAETLTLHHRPDFRVAALAAFKIEDSQNPDLLFAGGDPGVSGIVAWRTGARKIADDMIYSIAISPDAKFAAAACADGRVLVCAMQEGLAEAEWKLRHQHTAAARAVTFSPDGEWLASAGLDGAIIVSPVAGDNDQQPQHLDGHTDGIDCLTFSPDSGLIASGSRDSKIRVHQVSGNLLRSYKGLGMADEPIASRVPARILSIAWGGNHLVAGTSKGTLHRLSLEDDRSSKIEHGGSAPITALTIDQANQRLIVADQTISEQPTKSTN